MSSSDESASLIALAPFIREFTRDVVESIRHAKGIVPLKRDVIHADLVPQVPQQFVERAVARKPVQVKQVALPPPKLIQAPHIQPLENHVEPVPVPLVSKEQAASPPVVDGYGKITPLLNDSSISVIECPGPGKQIVIIRAGQRQFTQIVLTGEEILHVLEEISAKARIPLLEGVFRAAVDHFLINAIISEMVGSKFVITKQIYYGNMPGQTPR